jgi:hypothetical protein
MFASSSRTHVQPMQQAVINAIAAGRLSTCVEGKRNEDGRPTESRSSL